MNETATALKEDRSAEIEQEERAETMTAAPGPAVDESQADPDRNVVSQPTKPTTIHIYFETNSDRISIRSKATGEKSTVVAANKKLHLIHGRLYFIPVDSKVNSDEYGNIKEFSQTTEKFDIRYVKDGVACVDPIQHNAIIEDGQQLCVLW